MRCVSSCLAKLRGRYHKSVFVSWIVVRPSTNRPFRTWNKLLRGTHGAVSIFKVVCLLGTVGAIYDHYVCT